MAEVAERVTDTGVLVNGEWLNFSKFGKKPNITAGASYEFTTKEFKGRKYIQSAKEIADETKQAAPVKARSAETQTASVGAGVAKAEWAAREDDKSRRILVQGILQACLQSPGLVGFASNTDEYLAAVEAATKREVDFVNAMVR